MTLGEKISALMKGEMVSKADFERVNSELKQALDRVAELEKAATEPKVTIVDPNPDLEAAVEECRVTILARDNEITHLKSQVKDLEGKVKQPSRQASAILAQAGVEPVTQTISQLTREDKMDFRALVKAQMSGGKSKGEAIQFCVKNFPDEYRDWRTSGDTSKL